MPPTTPLATARFERMLLLFALIAATLLGARLLPGRTVWSGDEADLVRLARAMATEPLAWLRPDYHPGAFQRLGDGIVAPPLASALIALPALLGWGASSAWPLASAALLLASLAALGRALGPAPGGLRAGHLAAALLVVALAPRLTLDVLTLEAEVPLAAFSCFSLALLLGKAPGPGRAAAAGALLGLAFLAKLWLAGPPALAAAGALLAWRPRPRVVVAFLAAAVGVALSHLAIVALLDGASLGRWLREVYLAPFLASGGVASTKWAGVAAHPGWSHGPHYYPPAIARELGGALPLALLGAYRAARGPGRVPALGAFAGLAAGVAVLSVPAIKEPLYVLPAIAVGASAAAAGLLALPGLAALAGRRLAAAAALVAVALAAFARPPATTPQLQASLLASPPAQAGTPRVPE